MKSAVVIVTIVAVVLIVLGYEITRARRNKPELINPNEARDLALKFGLFVMPSNTPAETLVQIFEVALGAITRNEEVSRTSEFVSFFDRLRRTIVAWAHEGSPFV